MTNKNIYNDSTIKVGTFFSGIGAPEKALKKLKDENVIEDYEVKFFSEIDKYAVKSYCVVHNIDKSLNLGDITKINGKDLPYCDLWIGGFPCQDISCAGKMKGFDLESTTRSSLGWEMIRLISEVEVKPKYVIFENVKNITSKAFKETLKLFKDDLEYLGYTLYDNVLSATDFDIPQMRKRYFLVAVLDSNKKFTFPKGKPTNKKIKNMLEKTVDERYYYTDSNCIKNNENLIFSKKDNHDRKYIININKFYKGGVCGYDDGSNYNQSKRIYSENGYAPTLTASNTAECSKIIVESEEKICE